ncbi:hypothetical protein HJC23_007408 [Cyclotella cryptica]|uniref:Peptidylprolyl isomerase n=1 Tax=Cyclotella cryptica TaxID=29204 RepID=A0ABD3QQ54_9STRA|eukprot:CCRYP_005140-RA/>CCRYP_005140-RA protein AED:0.10 eAED:0.10 QI:0/0.5/0/1/1/1/3/0/418
MDKIDVDGTPFSVLMDRAVKLKSFDLSRHRRHYDTMPVFCQNSIFPNDDVIEARSLSEFNDRIGAAKRMKDEGNSAYREGRLCDALSKYENALAVFRFLENTNPSWKTEGIKDKFIKEIQYECTDEAETQELNLFLTNCYNNIAIVCHSMKKYNISVKACDYALLVDSKCDKSFFLRARSRLAPLSSGAVEQEAAVRDLEMALQINPQNREARKLLRATSIEAKYQRSRDKKTFDGLFTRGEIYDAHELLEAKGSLIKCKEKDESAAKEMDLILGRQLLQHYEERGMKAEKENIEKSLDAEMRRRGKTLNLNNVNFRKPTNKMIQDAKSMGVDLFDPQTLQILEQLQQNGGSFETQTAPCLYGKQSTNKEAVVSAKRRSYSWVHYRTVAGIFLFVLSAGVFMIMRNLDISNVMVPKIQ